MWNLQCLWANQELEPITFGLNDVMEVRIWVRDSWMLNECNGEVMLGIVEYDNDIIVNYIVLYIHTVLYRIGIIQYVSY